MYFILAVIVLIAVYKLSFYFRNNSHECPHCGSMNLAEFYVEDGDTTFYTTCRKCKKIYTWIKRGPMKKSY